MGKPRGGAVRKRPAGFMKRVAKKASESDTETSESDDESGDSLVLKKRPKVAAACLPKGDPAGLPLVNGAELAAQTDEGMTLLGMGRVGRTYGRLLVRVDQCYEPAPEGLWAEVTALEVSSGAKGWWTSLAGPSGPGLIHICSKGPSCNRAAARTDTDMVVHIGRGAIVDWNDADIQRRVLLWLGVERSSSVGAAPPPAAGGGQPAGARAEEALVPRGVGAGAADATGAARGAALPPPSGEELGGLGCAAEAVDRGTLDALVDAVAAAEGGRDASALRRRLDVLRDRLTPVDDRGGGVSAPAPKKRNDTGPGRSAMANLLAERAARHAGGGDGALVAPEVLRPAVAGGRMVTSFPPHRPVGGDVTPGGAEAAAEALSREGGGGSLWDEDPLSVFRGASLQPVVNLDALARQQHGSLLTSAMLEVDRFLAARGEAASSGVGRFVQYLVTVYHQRHSPEQVGLRNAREMRTIAESLDAILEGNIARAGDVLVQRLKAIEVAVSDGSWAVAQHHELIAPVDVSLVTSAERSQTNRLEVQRSRLHEAVQRGGGGQNAKGQGRGPRPAGG